MQFWGQWARRFYGRHRVLLWTSRGLAAPVRTLCGFSHGCTLAATAYGTLGVLRTRCLCHAAGWCLGPGLWLHESVYCDDQRWLGRSRAEVVRVAEAAHGLAQDACAPSNEAKFAYTHLELAPDGGIRRVSADVAVFGSVIRSSLEPPVIVGITLEPEKAPPKFVAKYLACPKYVKRSLRRSQPAFLLAARSVLAYFVSKLDAVARGSYLPAGVPAALQPTVNGMYRTILSLLQDVPLTVLLTPVHEEGWGAPVLSVRCELNFLQGYLAAFEGHNALVHRVLRAQWGERPPHLDDDACVVQRLCRAYGLQWGVGAAELTGSGALQLSDSVLASTSVYVTTDAGHEPSARMAVRRERGGARGGFRNGVWSAADFFLGFACRSGL